MSKFKVGDKVKLKSGICCVDLNHIDVYIVEDSYANAVKLLGKPLSYVDDAFMPYSTKDSSKPISELSWQHNRSALVHLMHLEGHKYIMCEVADEDKDFDWMDSLEIVIINTVVEHEDGRLSFGDIEGNVHNAAQPIKGNGHIMDYRDYLKLEKFGEE